MNPPIDIATLVSTLIAVATAVFSLRKVRIETAKVSADTQESVIAQYDKLVERYLDEIKRLIEDKARIEREHNEHMLKIQSSYEKKLAALAEKITQLEYRVVEQSNIIVEQTRQIQILQRGH